VVVVLLGRQKESFELGPEWLGGRS